MNVAPANHSAKPSARSRGLHSLRAMRSIVITECPSRISANVSARVNSCRVARLLLGESEHANERAEVEMADEDEETIELEQRTIYLISARGQETALRAFAHMFPMTVAIFSRDGSELWSKTVDDPGEKDGTLDMCGFWFIREEQGPVTCVVSWGDGASDVISARGVVHFGEGLYGGGGSD